MVEDLCKRSAQEVLDVHLNIAEHFLGRGKLATHRRGRPLPQRLGGHRDPHKSRRRRVPWPRESRAVGADTRRGYSARGCPNTAPTPTYYRAVEGRVASTEWAYEDASVMVRDGADSYLIEDGKIIAQTIHHTVEQKQGEGH